MKLLAIFLLLLADSQAGRILFMVPFSGPSHFHYASHFIRELINRGHHVTAITGIKLKNPPIGYSEVLIDPPYDFSKLASDELVFNVQVTSPMNAVKWIYQLGLDTSEHALQSKNVQDFIEKDDHFDLVVTEQFAQESFLMFAHKFQAPIVSIATMGYADYMDYAQGLITPWAYCPHLFQNYGGKMNFWERLDNTIVSLYDRWLRLTWYMPAQNDLARKYFKFSDLPNLETLEKSISVLMVNTQEAISHARPRMPNQINIGGAHINGSAEKLPKDIKNFMDGAEDGVVYMSLGAFVKSSKMPKERLDIFLRVFARLKQRVIWKFESDETPNLPEDVLVGKWMPQTDILAHPKMKLFITHGGIHGTYEGVFYGLPMLFMPFYSDQHRNALRAENAGIAIKTHFNHLTEDELYSKIQELLSNPKYKQNALKISNAFRDNPVHPMELAMYYFEYAMRNKGAKYLKSAATELAWYQNLLLDVFGLLAAGVFVVLLVLFALIKWIKSVLCKSKKTKQKRQ